MFRKLLCALLIGALLITAIPTLTLAETQYATVVTPTTDGSVYVRSGAGAGNSIVGVAKYNDQLIVLDRSSTWYKVKVTRTGVTGWMSGSYIKLTSNGSSGSVTPSSNIGVVKSSLGYANFRTGAGTNYSLICQLKSGTKLQLISKTGSWYYAKVRATNQYGYIAASLVSVDSTPTVQPTVKPTATPAQATTTVIKSSDGFANLRKGPGMSYAVVCSLYNGTPVEVTSVYGDWSRVEVPSTNQYGFIHTSLLRTSESVAPVTPEPTATPAPVYGTYKTGRITSGDGYANLRTGASTNNGILARLNNGVLVTIRGTEGNWYKVQLTDQGTIGYVHQTLIEFLPEEGTATASGNVNMRSGPSTGYPVKTVITKGTPVSVLSYYGTFAYVNADGWIGYVSRNYLK